MPPDSTPTNDEAKLPPGSGGAETPGDPAASARQDLLLLLLYMQLVYSTDVMAYWGTDFLIDWSLFKWLHGSTSFDFFKFTFWLVVPALCWRHRLPRGWLGTLAWTRRDTAIVLGLAAVGAAAMFLIPHFESLRAEYPSLAQLPMEKKLEAVRRLLAWNLSWLIGWEFLYRGVLLHSALRISPTQGWWMVPMMEAFHHITKPPLEMVGMFAFSVVLTTWARRRGSGLAPMLAHAIIEIELAIFLIMMV